MIQTTSVKPQNVEISRPTTDGACMVSLALNIKPAASVMDIELWTYDYYVIPAEYSDKLADEVTLNIPEWTKKGKTEEQRQIGENIRIKRDSLLNECDLKHCNASNWEIMTNKTKADWQKYKQALRDITLQVGFPEAIIWPVL